MVNVKGPLKVFCDAIRGPKKYTRRNAVKLGKISLPKTHATGCYIKAH